MNPSKFPKQIKRSSWLQVVAYLALLIGSVFVFISLWFGPPDIVQSLGIMCLNISITVLLINGLEQRRFQLVEKREFIKQMASASNHFATEAVTRLRVPLWDG